MRIELELPDELFHELSRVAEAMEISNAVEAATIAVADWVSRRKAELDDRDPEQRYFINEALDQLARKKS
jgi:predicted transcriptional regulator